MKTLSRNVRHSKAFIHIQFIKTFIQTFHPLKVLKGARWIHNQIDRINVSFRQIEISLIFTAANFYTFIREITVIHFSVPNTNTGLYRNKKVFYAFNALTFIKKSFSMMGFVEFLQIFLLVLGLIHSHLTLKMNSLVL